MSIFECYVVFDEETGMAITAGDNPSVAWMEAAKWRDPDCSKERIPSMLRQLRAEGFILCKMSGVKADNKQPRRQSFKGRGI